MCNCYGDLKDCSLNSSYYLMPKTNTYVDVGYANIIAGILYDLLPANSTTNGNISATYSTSVVTITFDKIKVFEGNTEYTFSITLIDDGSVIINYGSITKYPAFGLTNNGYNEWASGMRGPRSSSYTTNKFIFPYANLTSSQISKKSIWKTKYYGIYPDTLTVGGKYFVVCPISMTWTATTVKVTSSNYDSIKFKPISISCSSIFQLGSSLEIGIYLSSSPSVLDTCTYGATNEWFECKLSTILGNTPTPGDYNVYFAWREPTHSSSWSPMNANPLLFTFGTTLDSTTCAMNDYISSCDACDIYNNNDFTCLNLPCTQLYDHPDCNGNCLTTSTTDSNYHINDILGTCCALEDIDCSGLCYGTQSLGYEKLTSYVNISKCCNADCTSECDGQSKRDACGVCGGNDQSGKTCSTYVSIDTGYGSNMIYANITALEPNKPLMSLVNITNTNDTLINVKLSVSGSSYLGPHVTIAKGTTRIDGNSSKIFVVNTSLDTMINGDINGWEVKTVYVSYTRPSYSDFDFSYFINIYPQTENCSAITNRNTCMRLPGCIFCYTYPAIRVLSEEEEDSEYSDIKKSIWRRLFTNIMAEQAGVRTYSLSTGTCNQGWNTNDCPISNNGSRRENSYILLSILSFIISILILI